MISYDEKWALSRSRLQKKVLAAEGDDPKRHHLYEEAPWFYKRNGIYYMVYAASRIPENIAYSTSPSPTGPWTLAVLSCPQGSSFTNHPGLCDFRGRSYFFYHNGALPGGGGFTRSVCIEEFTYNPDGSFPELNMTTEGVSPIANLNPYVRNEAETIAWSFGVRTEECSQGGMNVCNIDNGDYIRVSSVDFGKQGAAAFSASVSSVRAGAKIELRLGSPDGDLIGTLDVPDTEGYENWLSATTSVTSVRGVHELFFVFKGDGEQELLKFDHWHFTEING